MSSWAKPGVKCVCVDATSNPGCVWRNGDAPVEGNTYTVRRTFIDTEGELVVDFLELSRSPKAIKELGGDVGYRISRFRPLITKTQEQDVALFRHILDGLPVGVDA